MSAPSSPRMPFPGMDPYLEHPALWPGVHTRLMVALANQVGPLIQPRYVASVEERVYIEDASDRDHRAPDVWVQKTQDNGPLQPSPEEGLSTPVIVEVRARQAREVYIEILDLYREQEVVTVIEVVSPANKRAGAGRESYQTKQRAVRGSECHLVEIDLLRRGRHVLSVPRSRMKPSRPYHYLVCVSRWPTRRRFEVYPFGLRDRMPRVRLPLAEPDGDVPLDMQAALEQIYMDAGYRLRVLYDQPCKPPLDEADQQWATEHWQAFKAARPDLFPRGGA